MRISDGNATEIVEPELEVCVVGDFNLFVLVKMKFQGQVLMHDYLAFSA